jgi:tetratricopeptide (TPR) repeat protein
VLGLFALSLLGAARGEARPSLWQRARRPASVVEERLLAGLERRLDEQELAGRDPSYWQHFVRAGVAMIDLSHVTHPADPRLACDMAKVLIAADLGRNTEAEALLEGAVAALPPSSLLADAWHELGMARALRGDDVGAREAQTRALELAWQPDDRASALYARAGSEVHLGDLPRATSDYRAAAELAHEPEMQALARFGLGVTLERLGDVPSAYGALEQGLAVRLPLSTYMTDDPLDLPGILFIPEYDRFYLRALLAMTRARHEDEPAARRTDYEQAIENWDAYLQAAERDEAWVEHARRHRQGCEVELRKLPERRHAPRPG